MVTAVMTDMGHQDQPCGYCANKLEDVFHSWIPLSRKLGVRVMYYDGKRLIIQAPLSVNAASCGSAFTGSVGSLLMLCGFGLIQLKLSEIGYGAHVMLGRCTISCEREVRADLRAFCELTSRSEPDRIRHILLHKKMANLHVVGGIECGAQAIVTFDGIYAVRRVRTADTGFLGPSPYRDVYARQKILNVTKDIE